MPSLPPQLLRRALVLDVLLCMLMLSLSLLSDQQLWRVIWGCGALVAVLDALLASRLLDLKDRG
ncbi:MAG: hypothetical protein VKJ87_06085 [Synechococcus sp.]|nr:hypothetical protein [Synechococcus sp.]